MNAKQGWFSVQGNTLRLATEGGEVAFSVPKRPSPDPADKRLAVRVAGRPRASVAGEAWDFGPVEEVIGLQEGLEAGKLLYRFCGKRMRGLWTIVRIEKKRAAAGKEWLLIKERDEFAVPKDAARTAAAVRAELERLRAPERSIALEDVAPMLAEVGAKPFTREGWVFEIKYDGFRLLCERDGEDTRLRYRSANDASGAFPEVGAAMLALPFGRAIIDGEVVVADEADGRPNFQRLQQRFQLLDHRDVERAACDHPATLFAFDLLALDGRDLRALPLVERKALLKAILPADGPLRYAEHVERRGEDFFEAARLMDLEGIVAKRADAPYKAGRSPLWLKLRLERTADLAVVGFTAARGARNGFGALHLAGWREGTLVYAGRVGSGFSEKQLGEVRKLLDPARRPKPPCGGALPAGRGHTWVEPHIVCEVRYRQFTEDGLLRLPIFLRFRNDKRVEDCDLPAEGYGGTEPS